MRLEWLRIGRWNGEIPREVRADQTRIHRADGSIIYGQLTGFDAASKEFLFKTETGESRVPETQISSVFLSVPKDEAPRMIRAVYQDGSRVSGDLVKVEDGVLVLKVPGIHEQLRLPLAGLRSLVVLRQRIRAEKARGQLQLLFGIPGVDRAKLGRSSPIDSQEILFTCVFLKHTVNNCFGLGFRRPTGS